MEAVRERDGDGSGVLEPHPPTREVSGRPTSAAIGTGAGVAMIALYVAVVTGASRSLDHVLDQIGTDRYLLLPIVTGFAIQVTLLVEVRRRQRLQRRMMAAGAAGAGASGLGMMACCAHHLADLLPLVGATATATFLYHYRLPFMLVGIGLNALAIALALRRLKAIPVIHEEVGRTCVPDGSSP
jgi:hypothetical protein